MGRNKFVLGCMEGASTSNLGRIISESSNVTFPEKLLLDPHSFRPESGSNSVKEFSMQHSDFFGYSASMSKPLVQVLFNKRKIKSNEKTIYYSRNVSSVSKEQIGICIDLPRETVKKLLKNINCFLVWCLRPWLYTMYVMPNQRAADKETLSFYVPRTLGKRLRKLARSKGETLTDHVLGIINKSVAHVELTAEDYEEIARETRAAQIRNSARNKKKAP